MVARHALSLVVVSVACTIAATASADITKAQCIASDTHAQDLRRDGKLAATRAELRTCSDPTCPGVVRDDCAKRMVELDAAQPTVVFEVKDGQGNDVSAVSVKMDGASLTESITGAALAVDPGAHTFTFTVMGQPPATRSLIVAEGVKGRHEVVSLGEAHTAAPAGDATVIVPQEVATPGGHGMGTQKLLGLVTAGVGVAGLIVGGVTGGLAFSEKTQEETDNTKNPSQAPSDRSSGMTDGTISTVGFIAGGVLVATGAVLFFTAKSKAEPAAPSASLVPSVGPGGGGLLLRGTF